MASVADPRSGELHSTIPKATTAEAKWKSSDIASSGGVCARTGSESSRFS